MEGGNQYNHYTTMFLYTMIDIVLYHIYTQHNVPGSFMSPYSVSVTAPKGTLTVHMLIMIEACDPDIPHSHACIRLKSTLQPLSVNAVTDMD